MLLISDEKLKTALNRARDFREGFYGHMRSEESFATLRESKTKMLQNLLSTNRLGQLTEDGVFLLAENLWSTMMWTNKQYVTQSWIRGAGEIDNLRKALTDLIWGPDDIAKRYDRFRNQVKGMGSATITEILNAARPGDYPIWNQQVRRALEKLGIQELSKLSNINGSQYKQIINMLKPFIEVIKDKNNLPNPDYLDLDYFFYYVATGVDTSKVDIGQEHELDHEEMVRWLMQVGSGLGFEVMSEVPIAPGAKVDVVWQTRIANLGAVKYMFEVHVGGSIDSLLMNFSKAVSDASVQKVVAVSHAKALEKIRMEAAQLKYLHDKIIYWEVDDLRRVTELIEELNSIMQKLGLIKFG